MLKENLVLKWVHIFGIDSLNDLLINTPAQKEKRYEGNQEQNQEQIKLESLKTFENFE